MKRLLSLLLCASVFIVFGCDTTPDPTPEPTPDPVLSVSPESLSFTADGGSQTVQVKANNPWTASASGTGISVNPSSGDGDATVTVTATATNSTDPITGAVSFRSGGLSASVSITQEEKKVIQVGDVMTIPAEGGSFAVDVQYNTDIDVEIEASAKSWIEFVAVRALQSGKLEFRFAENGSTDPRQGKVTVKDKNGKVSPITLTFVQEEKKVIAVGDVMDIPAEGGTFAVDVQYNTDVVVEIESAAQSWIRFVAVRALTSGKLEFRFAENGSTDPRQGTVTVKDKNGKVSPITLTFVQSENKIALEESRIKSSLIQIYNAMDGPNWNIQNKWALNKDLSRWSGVVWNRSTGELQLSFKDFGLKGQLPDCFDGLSSCVRFYIENEPGIIGGLPESFGQLSNLERLRIDQTSMTHLPDVFGNLKKLQQVFITRNELMTGQLPESLSSSEKMEFLWVSNNSITGSIPASWSKVIGCSVDVGGNCLSGKISYLFKNRDEIRSFIKRGNLWQKDGYGFDISDIDIPGYDFWIDDPVAGPDGSLFTFDDVISKSKYTVYVIWASWCPFSRTLMPALKDYYETYRQDGLEVIATSQVGGVDENGAGHMIADRDGYFKEVVEKGYDKFYTFYWPDYGTSYQSSTPNAEVYDHNGNIIFSSFRSYPDPVRNRFGKVASYQLIPFLETLFGPATPPDPYESQDYSQDGQVLTLQKASVGKGINIVFMGDAYTDKDMGSGGVYETAMNQAMEQFFAVEPYKTFRKRFNVYAVKVVSKNGRIGSGYTTALGTYFGSGTYVDGNNDKCYEYALKVPGIDSREDLLVSVLVNSNHNAGTAILYRGDQSAVARVPSFGNDPDAFGSTLQHEAGGHGFAFLADEYATNNGTPPQSFINEYNDLYDKYGWYSNVDFTSDPAKIRWSAFLNDSRYSGQVGIYEGAALYTNGAWRPTANSIMKDNYGGFNAPSRWAIYKQIMKRSGETASFEKFLEYDAVNRTSASSAPRPPLKAAAAPKRSIEHGAPPVIMP